MIQSDAQRRAIFARLYGKKGGSQRKVVNTFAAIGGTTLAIRMAPKLTAEVARRRFVSSMVRRGAIRTENAKATNVLGTLLRPSTSRDRVLREFDYKRAQESKYGARLGKVRSVSRSIQKKLPLRAKVRAKLYAAAEQYYKSPILKSIDPASVIIKAETIIKGVT